MLLTFGMVLDFPQLWTSENNIRTYLYIYWLIPQILTSQRVTQLHRLFMTLVSISEYHFPATLSYNKCCIRCGNKGVPTRFLKHMNISKTHFNLNGSNLASRDHIPVSLENNINFDPQGRNSHLRWSYIVNIWLQSNNICLFSISNSIVYHG